MRKIILFISISFIINTVNSQDSNLSKEKFDAYKKLYLTDKLSLDPETETEFWIAYKKYEDSLTKLIRNHRANFRKDLRNSSPSDEEFNNFINNYMSYEKKKIDMRANLISELKEVMSLRKTYMLFRYEDDFRREMMEKLRESQNNKKN
jgi:hypothetical protein